MHFTITYTSDPLTNRRGKLFYNNYDLFCNKRFKPRKYVKDVELTYFTRNGRCCLFVCFVVVIVVVVVVCCFFRSSFLTKWVVVTKWTKTYYIENIGNQLMFHD